MGGIVLLCVICTLLCSEPTAAVRLRSFRAARYRSTSNEEETARAATMARLFEKVQGESAGMSSGLTAKLSEKLVARKMPEYQVRRAFERIKDGHNHISFQRFRELFGDAEAPVTGDGEKKIARQTFLKHFKMNSRFQQKYEANGDAPSLSAINYNNDENQAAHNTAGFDAYRPQEVDLVLRRGQPFRLSFVVYGDTSDMEYSINQTPLSVVPVETAFRSHEYAIKIISQSATQEDDESRFRQRFGDAKATQFEVLVMLPISHKIGYHVVYVQVGDQQYDVCQFAALFNPWSPYSDVYINQDKYRKEFVEEQHGILYTGDLIGEGYRGLDWMEWNYHQYEVLPVVFELLALAGDSAFSTPVDSSRALTWLLNDVGNTQGLLSGNWDGDYGDGTDPTLWTGSRSIFLQWHDERFPVRWAQCWVWSGVLTTALRSLGIPARSITNYGSAHVNAPQMGAGINTHVWNFHMWVEAWIKRKDIALGFQWNVVDATPQWTSEGKHQTGPAAVINIKKGRKDRSLLKEPFDSFWVYSEVNVLHDPRHPDDDLSDSDIGQFISTKRSGCSIEQAFTCRNDLTKFYKENFISEPFLGSSSFAAVASSVSASAAYRNSLEKSEQFGKEGEEPGDSQDFPSWAAMLPPDEDGVSSSLTEAEQAEEDIFGSFNRTESAFKQRASGFNPQNRHKLDYSFAARGKTLRFLKLRVSPPNPKVGQSFTVSVFPTAHAAKFYNARKGGLRVFVQLDMATAQGVEIGRIKSFTSTNPCGANTTLARFRAFENSRNRWATSDDSSDVGVSSGSTSNFDDVMEDNQMEEPEDCLAWASVTVRATDYLSLLKRGRQVMMSVRVEKRNSLALDNEEGDFQPNLGSWLETKISVNRKQQRQWQQDKHQRSVRSTIYQLKRRFRLLLPHFSFLPVAVSNSIKSIFRVRFTQNSALSNGTKGTSGMSSEASLQTLPALTAGRKFRLAFTIENPLPVPLTKVQISIGSPEEDIVCDFENIAALSKVELVSRALILTHLPAPPYLLSAALSSNELHGIRLSKVMPSTEG